MLSISDVSTFTVPENLILLYLDDEVVKGKKHDASLVTPTADDLRRLDVAQTDLPCFVFEEDFVAAHAKSAMSNPTMRSAFEQSAAANYTDFVGDQKVSKPVFLSKIYELSEMIDDVATEAIGVTGSGAIGVSGEGTTKTIGVAVDGTTIVQTGDELASVLTIAKQQVPETGYAATYFLADNTGAQISGSEKINIVKDQFLKAASLVWGTAAALSNGSVTGEANAKSTTAVYPFIKLELYVNDNGASNDDTSVATVYIPVDELFHDYTNGNGISIDSQVISVLKDASSGKVRIAATPDGVTAGSAQDTGLVDVLTVGANGVKVDNIQAAIDYAVGNEATARETAIGDASTSTANDGSVYGAIKQETANRNTAIGDASTSVANDGSVYGAIKQEASDRAGAISSAVSAHNTDARHSAAVLIVSAATTVAEMAYTEYVCKAALTGTLPAAPAAGTKRIVSVVAGGEGTTISPASGDTIAGAATAMAINLSNDTVTFVYDADDSNWIVL